MDVMNEVFGHLQKKIIPLNNTSCFYLNTRHTEEQKRNFPFFTYIIFNVLESIWLNEKIIAQDIKGLNDLQFFGIQRICLAQFGKIFGGKNEKSLLKELNELSTCAKLKKTRNHRIRFLVKNWF